MVLRALGAVGAELMKEDPPDWKGRLLELTTIDWSKKNKDWENVCIIANSVVSNRQARFATKAYLKTKLGLSLSDAEVRALRLACRRLRAKPRSLWGAATAAPHFLARWYLRWTGNRRGRARRPRAGTYRSAR